MGSLRTRYIGSISNEAQAAQIYDFYSVITHGLKAKTNFSYTKADIKSMVQRIFDGQGVKKNAFLEKVPK